MDALTQARSRAPGSAIPGSSLRSGATVQPVGRRRA
jgi:hypothetical protein